MRIDVTVQCPVHNSFRVQQVAGMFDVALAEKLEQSFRVDVPGLDEDWRVGAIVGPSGSGKSTVAAAAYGEDFYRGEAWPTDKAVMDCFGEKPIKEITAVLTAVGFSSPPSWIKPYAVLSNGEKFRCDLARSLLGGRKLIAFDEFSSVVDRTVAKVGSAAIAKSIRNGRVDSRFVAVTCHYDIIEWLEPDWVLDMATGALTRGLVQRPEIRLEIVRCKSEAWKLFAKHHYMSGTLHQSAQCHMALWNGEPVAFCAIQANFGHKGNKRLCRTVVLPDYQGIGIGTRLSDAVAQIYTDQGYRVTTTIAHPALIRHRANSRLWRLMRVSKTGEDRQRHAARDGKPRVSSAGRAVASFEYIGTK